MSRKKAEAEGAKDTAPGFEKALERLEEIVREMENGELSLETMVARFEEGQKLVRACGATLSQIERRIEILVQEGDKVVAKPMDEAAGNEEDPDEGVPGEDKPGVLPF